MKDCNLHHSHKSHAAILSADGQRLVEVEELYERFGAGGLIRLHMPEFAEFRTLNGKYTHFNLEKTLNEVGVRYAILPIVQAGYRTADGREVIPVYDADQYRLGVCVEVVQGVQVDEVTPDHFKFSLPSVRNAEQLKGSLVNRYSRLYPNISAKELLSRGCAISVVSLET